MNHTRSAWGKARYANPRSRETMLSSLGWGRTSSVASHRDLILEQFTRQAIPFSTAPGIRDEEALAFLTEASGATPLHSAAGLGSREMVGRLLAAGAELVLQSGQTLFELLAKCLDAFTVNPSGPLVGPDAIPRDLQVLPLVYLVD